MTTFFSGIAIAILDYSTASNETEADILKNIMKFWLIF